MITGSITKHIDDAGSDIPCKRYVIPALSMAILETNTEVEDVDAIVMARTSTTDSGLLVIPTLVDRNYKGPIHVHVFNTNTRVMYISDGDCIAQIVPFIRDHNHLPRGTAERD